MQIFVSAQVSVAKRQTSLIDHRCPARAASYYPVSDVVFVVVPRCCFSIPHTENNHKTGKLWNHLRSFICPLAAAD